MDETDAAAAEAQSGENESDPDLDLGPSALRNTFRCQCRKCVARDRRQDCVCCCVDAECVEKVRSALKETRRCTAVAVDFPLFARISIQLRVLDDIERLLGHDQAPSKRLTQQLCGNLLSFASCASLAHQWTFHPPLFVFFLHIFAVFTHRLKLQSSRPTNVVEIPRSLETD